MNDISPMNDNTVGPVMLTSGYGSNTFPYSAAHVLNTSTMLNVTPPIHSNRVFNDEGLFNTSSVTPISSYYTCSSLDPEVVRALSEKNEIDSSLNSTKFTGSTFNVMPKSQHSFYSGFRTQMRRFNTL